MRIIFLLEYHLKNKNLDTNADSISSDELQKKKRERKREVEDEAWYGWWNACTFVLKVLETARTERFNETDVWRKKREKERE